MPDPNKYKNKKNWMSDCMHQVVHVEKKDKDQGIAQCLNMWRQRKDKAQKVAQRFINADYPDHPDEIVISKRENIEGLKEIKEIDVYNYYVGIKNEILKELKGRNLFIVIKPKGELKRGEKGIYIRHPYDKKTEFIRINNGKEFEIYHSGRTVEYHPTTPQITPWYIIDIDAGTGPFSQVKKITANVADEMDKLPEVKKVEIRYTGKRGFHVFGWLKKNQDVDKAREYLHNWLNKTFSTDDNIIIGESPKGKKSALGLSPMKLNGGHVAKYSLRVSGLCCVEVPRDKLLAFEKRGASIDMTYKKITGQIFQRREAAKRVIEGFLKNSIVWIEPKQKTRRLTPTMRLRTKKPNFISEKEKEFAKPGEMVEVYEAGKWIKKPFRPSMKNKEIRPIEKPVKNE